MEAKRLIKRLEVLNKLNNYCMFKHYKSKGILAMNNMTMLFMRMKTNDINI